MILPRNHQLPRRRRLAQSNIQLPLEFQIRATASFSRHEKCWFTSTRERQASTSCFMLAEAGSSKLSNKRGELALGTVSAPPAKPRGEVRQDRVHDMRAVVDA